MKTVTLDIRTPREVSAEFVRVWKSRKADPNARISFATPELLWKVLTAKRWELIKAMAGQGPMTLREAARRADRDVKAVHGDVHALLAAGILRKDADGKIEFPFDAVHVDFKLKAA
ncbi:MAG: DNA-binding protein [Betaproteobacteria bacterium]|nr:DNA-binding protein [Betaproteobacteria bacterium]